MKFTPTDLAGLFVIEIEPMGDDRGWFARAFCKREFAERGLCENFVQSNFSFNPKKGTEFPKDHRILYSYRSEFMGFVIAALIV